MDRAFHGVLVFPSESKVHMAFKYLRDKFVSTVLIAQQT